MLDISENERRNISAPPAQRSGSKPAYFLDITIPQGERVSGAYHTGLILTFSPSRGFGIGHICQSAL